MPCSPRACIDGKSIFERRVRRRLAELADARGMWHRRRCAGYATIPRTLLPEGKRNQEAGRRVIAANGRNRPPKKNPDLIKHNRHYATLFHRGNSGKLWILVALNCWSRPASSPLRQDVSGRYGLQAGSERFAPLVSWRDVQSQESTMYRSRCEPLRLPIVQTMCRPSGAQLGASQ